jgi:hypothetical protein
VRDPEVADRLDALVDPLSRGYPESPLRWTSKSTRQLAATLTREGHSISHETVAQVLRNMGCGLQANRKLEEGRTIRIETRSSSSLTTKSGRRSPRSGR